MTLEEYREEFLSQLRNNAQSNEYILYQKNNS